MLSGSVEAVWGEAERVAGTYENQSRLRLSV